MAPVVVFVAVAVTFVAEKRTLGVLSVRTLFVHSMSLSAVVVRFLAPSRSAKDPARAERRKTDELRC